MNHTWVSQEVMLWGLLDPNSQVSTVVDCFLSGFWDALCTTQNWAFSQHCTSLCCACSGEDTLLLARIPGSKLKTITGRLHYLSPLVHSLWSPANLLGGGEAIFKIQARHWPVRMDGVGAGQVVPCIAAWRGTSEGPECKYFHILTTSSTALGAHHLGISSVLTKLSSEGRTLSSVSFCCPLPLLPYLFLRSQGLCTEQVNTHL